ATGRTTGRRPPRALRGRVALDPAARHTATHMVRMPCCQEGSTAYRHPRVRYAVDRRPDPCPGSGGLAAELLQAVVALAHAVFHAAGDHRIAALDTRPDALATQ